MPESLVGQTLAEKYLVEGLLGDGGMSTVLAARHVVSGDRVALKLLRADLADNEYVVSRFLREGRISTRIRSRHVVKVRDVGRLDDGVPFMVMDLLEGEDLEQRLKRQKPLPIETAVDLAIQACDALTAAHATGIIHRDIKPGNLFLTEEGGRPVLKVFDFGISKVEGDVDEGHRTSAQEIFGSPFYMSPEQLLSSTDVDTRADLWSLGVVLYEMLTGKLPFEADVLAKLHLAVLQGEPIDIRNQGICIPDRLAEVVHGCLAREREDRWQSMRALAEELEHYASPDGVATLEELRRTKHAGSSADWPASDGRVLTPGGGIDTHRPSLRALGTTSERAIAIPKEQSSHKTLTPWARQEELRKRRKTGAVVGFVAGATVLTFVFMLGQWRASASAPAAAAPPPPPAVSPPPSVVPSVLTSTVAAPPAEAAPAPLESKTVERAAPKKRGGSSKTETVPPASARALPDDRY